MITFNESKLTKERIIYFINGTFC